MFRPMSDFSRIFCLSRLSWAQRQGLLLLVSAALLLLVFENTSLDFELIRPFYDPQNKNFPLHHNGLLEKILHKGGRRASQFLGVIAYIVCILGMIGKLRWLPSRNAILAALGMSLITGMVHMIKAHTNRYCPSQLIDFGGFAPYVSLLEPAVSGLEKAGNCFPGGHASAGFLWIIWAMALRPAGRRAACAALAFALITGHVFGLVRMIQGEHFLSHQLWTWWVAWAVSLVLAVLLKADLNFPDTGNAVGIGPPEGRETKRGAFWRKLTSASLMATGLLLIAAPDPFDAPRVGVILIVTGLIIIRSV
jgi:membrane-associated PAP2 superfamily phosphatase